MSLERLSSQDKEDASGRLNTLLESCEKLGLRDAKTTISLALRWFKNSRNNDPDAAMVHLEHVQRAFNEQIGDIRFLGLAKDRAEFYGNVGLFGLNVMCAFPSAGTDIKSALNCLALELNTACVFHLMRVAEVGLRALARDRQVQFPKAPIELASWEEIIRKLEDAEERIHQYPKTLHREQQYEFYHGALMEVRRFKNVWRNNIMHARDDYDRNQALSVFNHVRDFMIVLANRISEQSEPLPEIWTEETIEPKLPYD